MKRLTAVLVSSLIVTVFCQDDLCEQHSNIYAENFNNGTDWALRMYDASTKLPVGILMGTSPHYGNYAECTSTHAPGFTGQYCRVFLTITRENGSSLPMSFHWSVCAPSTCNSTGVARFAEGIMSPISQAWGLQTAAETEANSCNYELDPSTNLDAGFWCTVGLFLAILALVVLSTVGNIVYKSELDVLKKFKGKDSKSRRALFAFALDDNWAELLSVRAQPAATLTCLHGLRVVSLAWVIVGHSVGMNFGYPSTNYIPAFQKLQYNWKAMPLTNGYMSVDTFLFIGGVLTCYVFMLKHNKGRPSNPLRYYLYRYLRLTPALLITVLFVQNVMYQTGTGPYWKSTVGSLQTCCEVNWWATLLYINNYVGISQMCLNHSWYLSIDMQLAVIAALVFLALTRWPRPTLAALAVTTLALCFYTFAFTYTHELFWTFHFYMFDPVFFNNIYIQTQHRAAPYIIGYMLGYGLVIAQQRKLQLRKTWVWLGWTLNTLAALAIVYTVAIGYAENYVYNPVDAAFYAGFHRAGWAICMSWIVFACTFGYGGPVNSILSWRGWLPLSRVSYCAYLIHYPVMHMVAAANQNPVTQSFFRLLHRYFSDFFLAIILASIIYLAVEAPTNKLLRILFNKERPAVRGTTDQRPETKNTKST